MSSSIREWLNLSVRWFHVFAGVMWVGQTYYFTWLDGQFGKLEQKASANGPATAVAWGLMHLCSGRAASSRVGALFGPIRTLKVWMRILPAQGGMIAAAAAGAKFDASLGEQAKLRSKHNPFMAVPVVFLMLSNHF